MGLVGLNLPGDLLELKAGCGMLPIRKPSAAEWAEVSVDKSSIKQSTNYNIPPKISQLI